MSKRGTLKWRCDGLDGRGSVSAVLILNVELGIVAYYSDCPTYRQGDKEPDSSTEESALAVEEAPIEG